jgi:hypothetical protein
MIITVTKVVGVFVRFRAPTVAFDTELIFRVSVGVISDMRFLKVAAVYNASEENIVAYSKQRRSSMNTFILANPHSLHAMP